jgi:hypothetical protein
MVQMDLHVHINGHSRILPWQLDDATTGQVLKDVDLYANPAAPGIDDAVSAVITARRGRQHWRVRVCKLAGWRIAPGCCSTGAAFFCGARTWHDISWLNGRRCKPALRGAASKGIL